MSQIHPSAIIGRKVELGPDNVIGPHVIIEDGVRLGAKNVLMAGAYLCAGTRLGDRNEVHMRAVIGHAPQDLAYKGEETFTKIGDRNIFREFVTIHRGTKAGTSTVIGNDNYLMAYCHVAHNCDIADRVIMVNQASLTGHVKVESGAFLSGMTGFHQFTRIGRLAMVSALSACNKDIPPFMIVGGRPGVALGINAVGLRRAGISAESRSEIKQAYKLLYRSGLNVQQALVEMESHLKSPEVKHLMAFVRESSRGIVDGANEQGGRETLKAAKSAQYAAGSSDLPEN